MKLKDIEGLRFCGEKISLKLVDVVETNDKGKNRTVTYATVGTAKEFDEKQIHVSFPGIGSRYVDK